MKKLDNEDSEKENKPESTEQKSKPEEKDKESLPNIISDTVNSFFHQQMHLIAIITKSKLFLIKHVM